MGYGSPNRLDQSLCTLIFSRFHEEFGHPLVAAQPELGKFSFAGALARRSGVRGSVRGDARECKAPRAVRLPPPSAGRSDWASRSLAHPIGLGW